ncbi:hypothetical protein ROZALSC1DRAFT_29320 [Rozella allomycis CSF55]|uniref:Uncharacterized protein n=1 Tax=Rozella allomycis (strain CSF55) TaxID=988480 RepID=A0A075AXH0_ROZAC|nr:hypothetical protein O9G_001585 [Rozella allomycis CSF55]RKP19035.1 hypothetical protein ROZALSC1DRAFT_29320 [Rozella allomycis CSF55]|eukprot:EPZ33234.1 hypothetical protein O9G_001585 [Rozella allomycis CSF55]
MEKRLFGSSKIAQAYYSLTILALENIFNTRVIFALDDCVLKIIEEQVDTETNLPIGTTNVHSVNFTTFNQLTKIDEASSIMKIRNVNDISIECNITKNVESNTSVNYDATRRLAVDGKPSYINASFLNKLEKLSRFSQ